MRWRLARHGCWMIYAAIALLWLCARSAVAAPEKTGDVQYIETRMGEYEVSEEDSYLCTAIELPDEPLKLVGIQPLAKQEIAHHMLLFGCGAPASKEKVWECHMVSPCAGGVVNGVSHGEQVMYGWGRDAPGMHLPNGAGFSVGPRTGITTAVLQVHYQIVRPKGDRTGVRLKMTRVPQERGAGMMMFAMGFVVPPALPSYQVPNNCCYNGFQPLEGFAFRVHAHALGRQIWMERSPDGGRTVAPQRVVGQDPQEPQGFYPVSRGLRFLPGDRLNVVCDFNSTERTSPTVAGSGSKNEMCNLYMMTTSELPYFMTCGNNAESVALTGPGGVRVGSTIVQESSLRWQPPPAATSDTQGGKTQHALGQVSGVTVGLEVGSVWVLHRGSNSWGFDTNERARKGFDADATPIAVAPVLLLEKDSGKVQKAWGEGRFIMPHSIAVDGNTGEVWITDVALHQAFKFSTEGQLLASVGTRWEPGDDDHHMCMPNAVAITRAGDILISDGYCNSRVVQYSPDGSYVGKYELSSGALDVPHALVVDDCGGHLYVADREGRKVHRFPLHPVRQPPPASDDANSKQTRAPVAANTKVAHETDTWDLSEYGFPYGMTAGPYGSIFVLCEVRRSGKVNLLMINPLEGGEVSQKWQLTGVNSPHDLTLTAAPLAVTGAGERLLAVYIAETRTEGSSLRKFIILPPGVSLPEPPINQTATAPPILPAVLPPVPSLASSPAVQQPEQRVQSDAALVQSTQSTHDNTPVTKAHQARGGDPPQGDTSTAAKAVVLLCLLLTTAAVAIVVRQTMKRRRSQRTEPSFQMLPNRDGSP